MNSAKDHMKEYRVSILAAGSGARLAAVTQCGHKALLRLGKKAVISHIIDLFPIGTTFVIALGHNGGLIQQYLALFHPDRKFVLVSSENYGRGFGPGYSLNLCREQLQVPFYSFACDTIVGDFLLDESTNWVGYSRVPKCNVEQYCTLEVEEETGVVRRFLDKDPNGTTNAWIGLAFVRDYEKFWCAMDAPQRFVGEELQLSPALAALPHVEGRQFSRWFDTGNLQGFKIASRAFGSMTTLEKDGEEVYFNDTHVLKYFRDPEMIRRKVERATKLARIVPIIDGCSANFYRYVLAPGRDFSQLEAPHHHLLSLLQFLEKYLWQDVVLSESEREDFRRTCANFYRTKTKVRLNQLFIGLLKEKVDGERVVNRIRVPPLETVLAGQIDWIWLCDGLPSTFHGDMNLSNVILIGDQQFALIDHREDFGGNSAYGDRYYDLAKIYQSFLLPHVSVRSGQFSLLEKGVYVDVETVVPESVAMCRSLFEEWCLTTSYDLQKIQVLSALTLINIAPLHGVVWAKHLYFLGRYHLSRFLAVGGQGS